MERHCELSSATTKNTALKNENYCNDMVWKSTINRDSVVFARECPAHNIIDLGVHVEFGHFLDERIELLKNKTPYPLVIQTLSETIVTE